MFSYLFRIILGECQAGVMEKGNSSISFDFFLPLVILFGALLSLSYGKPFILALSLKVQKLQKYTSLNSIRVLQFCFCLTEAIM